MGYSTVDVNAAGLAVSSSSVHSVTDLPATLLHRRQKLDARLRGSYSLVYLFYSRYWWHVRLLPLHDIPRRGKNDYGSRHSNSPIPVVEASVITSHLTSDICGYR